MGKAAIIIIKGYMTSDSTDFNNNKKGKQNEKQYICS